MIMVIFLQNVWRKFKECFFFLILFVDHRLRTDHSKVETKKKERYNKRYNKQQDKYKLV